MGINESNNDELVFVPDITIARKITIEEYRKKVRESLLIELANIFSSSLSTEWKSYEIADFLNSYRNNE